ncbi:hypothetical protein CAPTEDRAFT_187132 [Capitella teleta]|uniref:Uncharacterized protein n=1 Tax=Capitella teleta TaxID=283909 RepID=R7VH82_CAPTE|nr:hypothetical protein CAPTEDRAFT_187132 [Capitella teleta]|eukprot:ELU15656.1 hypothetical protein CAPTEDRAFT_187132 [Capitella teleta]
MDLPSGKCGRSVWRILHTQRLNLKQKDPWQAQTQLTVKHSSSSSIKLHVVATTNIGKGSTVPKIQSPFHILSNQLIKFQRNERIQFIVGASRQDQRLQRLASSNHVQVLVKVYQIESFSSSTKITTVKNTQHRFGWKIKASEPQKRCSLFQFWSGAKRGKKNKNRCEHLAKKERKKNIEPSQIFSEVYTEGGWTKEALNYGSDMAPIMIVPGKRAFSRLLAIEECL